IQDCLKGWSRPREGTLNLEETVVAEIAKLCKAYRITTLMSDRHSKDWVLQAFERHGIVVIHDDTYDNVSVPPKSDCYLELEAAMSQGQVKLVDHAELIRQLKFLQKTVRPGGKVFIDAPRSGHEDYANVTALLVHAITEAYSSAPEPVDQGINEDE